jgi:CubicO group peptidase (beta-lactamase class C family)
MEKSSMKYPIILAVFLLILPSCSKGGDLPNGDPRAEGFKPEVLVKIRPVLEKVVEERKIAGVSTLIARHGKIVHLETVGKRDVEANKPMERSTLFRIASMSKPITSAGVMVLVDEGKIKLDDPVSKYLPEFASPVVLVRDSKGTEPISTVPASKPITIHQLLTHTSGLTYRFGNRPVISPLYVEFGVSDGLSETPGTIGDNVKRLARLPLCSQPGTEWEYSLSTDVLGRLIEVVSGKTFDVFLREKLFQPLKMDDTGFLVPKAGRDRLSALYTQNDDNTIRRMADSPVQLGSLVYSGTFPTWETGHYYSGGAGLTSSITDYARFLQMILNQGELDGVRVLKRETVEMMTRHQIGDLIIPPWGHGEGFGYGFGIVREANLYKDRAGVGALSWAGFFHTYFWVDTKHQVIGIIMAQIAPARDLHMGADFKNLTYEALVD